MNTVPSSHPAAEKSRLASLAVSTVLLLVCLPAGVVRLRRRRARTWQVVTHAVAGLPFFSRQGSPPDA